jgi:hypothetical protein
MKCRRKKTETEWLPRSVPAEEETAMTSMNNQVDESRNVDWTDLGAAMWSYLTGRGAAINYTFEDMAVEVPRDTGHDAPRATWVLNGNLRITTSDDTTADVAPSPV